MGAGVGVTARSAVVVRRQLAGLEAENRLLRRQVAIDADRVAGLEADNARLTAQVQRLRGRLEASRREGKRQAAPFSPDTKQPNPKRPGRRPGGAYGTKARRDRPTDDRIDESVAVGLPACCPDCDGAVVFDEMREQFQEELVPAHSRVRREEVALGHCAGCVGGGCGAAIPSRRRTRSARRGVMLGPRAHALAAWLHVGCERSPEPDVCDHRRVTSVVAGLVGGRRGRDGLADRRRPQLAVGLCRRAGDGV